MDDLIKNAVEKEREKHMDSIQQIRNTFRKARQQKFTRNTNIRIQPVFVSAKMNQTGEDQQDHIHNEDHVIKEMDEYIKQIEEKGSARRNFSKKRRGSGRRKSNRYRNKRGKVNELNNDVDILN